MSVGVGVGTVVATVVVVGSAAVVISIVAGTVVVGRGVLSGVMTVCGAAAVMAGDACVDPAIWSGAVHPAAAMSTKVSRTTTFKTGPGLLGIEQ